nr:cell envelope integrity protein TolA [uncultured Massilia sp.]
MAAEKRNDNDTAGPHYRVPPEPNRWPAIGLAVGVHALLLAFLVIGVNWQSNTPVAVEAEIWDVDTQIAAPPAPPPEPEPEPEPETPPPEPTPRAVEPPPPPVEQPAPPKQPDIALGREKKRQEELKRKEQARLEREREEREKEREEQKRLEQQKREDDKKAKALAEKKQREQAEKEKEAADKKAREDAARKEAEQKKKDEAEKKKKADAEKKKQEAADQKKRDAARAEEMRRITGAAGSGAPSSTGTAEKSSAPGRDKGYVAAITAKVKGNTSYAGDLNEPGNPTVTFIVTQLPTGEILSVRKTKSSGVPAFDEAVEKGIRKSEPLPKKKDGTVERTLEINFRMKDLQ